MIIYRGGVSTIKKYFIIVNSFPGVFLLKMTMRYRKQRKKEKTNAVNLKINRIGFSFLCKI